MAYVPLTSPEIESGEPVKTTTMSKIKDNFADHETRILGIEGGGDVTYPPLNFRVNGWYGAQGPAEGWIKYIVNFKMRITGVRLYIDKAGTSGSTEIDLQFKRESDPYTTIFDVRPSVAYTEGDDAYSENQELDEDDSVLEPGDILRLDTTAVQPDGVSFTVRIDYIKTL